MALNFPSGQPDGTVWTDPNGEQWVYNAAENSWTSKGLVNETGGLKYKGGLNITEAPPSAESGDFWSVETGGTAHAGFGPGLTGDIGTGSLILYDGTGWELINVDPSWVRTNGTITPVTPTDVIHGDSGVTVGPNDEIELNADGSASLAGGAEINGLTVGRGAGNVSTNTAVGVQAHDNNTTGDSNTAVGYRALQFNTTGSGNTANGYQALRSNTTGIGNTANGRDALYNNTTGSNNTANGQGALYSNTTGIGNTANGRLALYSNTTGSGNFGAAFRNSGGTYAPVFNPTTENNRVVMGHTSVTNAYVQVAWTVVSDARDKMNFAPVPHGLDFINQLQPTAYQFKVDRDTEEPNGPVRYGFKAQDILALEGEDNAVIIDNENPDKLRYNGEALVPVLVNAIKEQQSIIETQQEQINNLLARLDAAGI